MVIDVRDIVAADVYQVRRLDSLGLNRAGVVPIRFTIAGRSYILITAWLGRHQEYWHVLRDATTGQRHSGGLLHADEQRTFRNVTGDPASPDLRIWFATRQASPPAMRPDTIANNHFLHVAVGRFDV